MVVLYPKGKTAISDKRITTGPAAADRARAVMDNET